MNITRVTIAACLAALAGAAAAQATIEQNKVQAGNFTPGDKAGFPLTISQPGSYKLISNLYVPDGVSGIEITAPNVTLDLNGFSIIGPRTCTRDTYTYVVTCTALSGYEIAGVHTTEAGSGAVIRQGTVQGFHNGIRADANVSVEDIGARFNGTGVYIGTTRNHVSRVSGVTATVNEAFGIAIAQAVALVDRSNVSNNGMTGLYMSPLSAAFDVLAISNAAHGVFGGAGHGIRATYNKGVDAGDKDFGGTFKSLGNNFNSTGQF